MPSRPAQPRPADHLRLVTPAVSAAATATAAVSLRPKGARAATARPAKEIRSFADWALHGLGVGAATASAGFATYALVFSTGNVVPSGNFNIFARYDHLYQSPTVRRGADTETASAPEATPPARGAVASREDGIDFTPTGTLSASDGVGGDAKAVQAGAGRPAAASRALPNFKLRDVFDGKALVESRSSLSVVRPGSVLDGAGQVLSIEKRGDQWVVLTENGVIAGQRR